MKHASLLEGSIKKQLFLLALPLLASNLLQQLYNTADSLIVGQYLGTHAFAATGISGTVMNLFIFVLNGFCVGTSMLFGQCYGAGDKERFRRCVFTAISFGCLLTICFSGLAIGFLRPILRLLSTPEELLVYCTQYLNVILAGLICTYMYNLFEFILRAMGDTKASLVFLTISVVLNVILDIFFISTLHMGIRGAAAATVIAQAVSAVCCLFYLKKTYPDYVCRREDVGFHRELLSKIMRFGLVSALQQSSLYLGKLLVQGAVNTLGTNGIAAFTAATRIEGFVNSLGESGSQSVSIFVSQNYGAKNKDRLRAGFKTGIFMFVGLSLVLSVLLYAFAGPSVSIFLKDSDPEVMSMGRSYLQIIAFFYFLCYTGYCFVGYYRGIGRLLIAFVGTTMHLSLRVILSYIFISRFGLDTVAFATGIGWVLCTTYHIIMYRRTRKNLRFEAI